MSARDDILSAIRAQRVKSAPRPAAYVPPAQSNLVAAFAERARAQFADVRVLDSAQDIPSAISDLLRGKNMAQEIHVAPGANFDDFSGIATKQTPPGPDDASLTTASFAIAETGTLVYPASQTNPASWHFRPSFEIAVLRASDILPHMENVLARIKTKGLPHTINFVTGPSRTADIEQTLELGAHGPKALAILILPE